MVQREKVNIWRHHSMWLSHNLRQSVVTRIEQELQRCNLMIPHTSAQLENLIYLRSATRERYIQYTTLLILQFRRFSQQKKTEIAAKDKEEQQL